MKSPWLTEAENRQIEKFKKALRKGQGPNFLKAVLFGSRARGEGNEDSDIDILVVLKEVLLETKHQIWDLADDIFLETGVDISPLVVSKAKFERWRKLERLLPKEIEEQGIPL